MRNSDMDSSTLVLVFVQYVQPFPVLAKYLSTSCSKLHVLVLVLSLYLKYLSTYNVMHVINIITVDKKTMHEHACMNKYHVLDLY